MSNKRGTGVFALIWLVSLPLWGGAGRPADGLLSFILLFGFLVFLLGILHLADCLKRILAELQKDIF